MSNKIVLDITAKVDEYCKSSKFDGLIEPIIKKMIASELKIDIENNSVLCDKIISIILASSKLHSLISKIHKDMTAGASFIDNLCKEIMISNAIKNETEKITRGEVSNQIDKQLSSAIEKELRNRLKDAESKLVKKIKKTIPEQINASSEMIEKIHNITQTYLQKFINYDLPAFVQAQIDMQFTAYLNQHHQMNEIFGIHSQNLNAQLDMKGREILGNLVNDPQYSEMKTLCMNSLKKDTNERESERNILFSNQLAKQKTDYDNFVKKIEKEIQNITEKHKNEQNILICQRLSVQNDRIDAMEKSVSSMMKGGIIFLSLSVLATCAMYFSIPINGDVEIILK